MYLGVPMILPASVRLVGRLPCRAAASVARTAGGAPSLNNLRQAEVGHLHPPAAVQQDVLRLDVAVDDALVVGVLEGVANLRHDGQRLARRDPAGAQQLPQAHPVHILHQQVIDPVRLAELEEGDDVRMQQLGQRLGFAGEAFGKGGVVTAARAAGS